MAPWCDYTSILSSPLCLAFCWLTSSLSKTNWTNFTATSTQNMKLRVCCVLFHRNFAMAQHTRLCYWTEWLLPARLDLSVVDTRNVKEMIGSVTAHNLGLPSTANCPSHLTLLNWLTHAGFSSTTLGWSSHFYHRGHSGACSWSLSSPVHLTPSN